MATTYYIYRLNGTTHTPVAAATGDSIFASGYNDTITATSDGNGIYISGEGGSTTGGHETFVTSASDGWQ